MGSQLQFQAAVLARDLRIAIVEDPVGAVVTWCEQQVGALVANLRCATLEELLDFVANKVSTRFRVVQSDRELRALIEEYRRRNETGFAALFEDLGPKVFGETLRLLNRDRGELRYVSVIDARGEKAPRMYFTKWHEIAHLLVLTDQARLRFFRSHAVVKDPEEQLMDAIAGRLAFFPPLLLPQLPAALTFEGIEALRTRMCPSASWQSTLNGVVACWPRPALLIRARVGLKRANQPLPGQCRLPGIPMPVGQLRAVTVIPNAAARSVGLMIYPNMRVPKASVIATANAATASADEDMCWWESSAGGPLPRRPVRVLARQRGEDVEAIVLDRATKVGARGSAKERQEGSLRSVAH